MRWLTVGVVLFASSAACTGGNDGAAAPTPVRPPPAVVTTTPHPKPTLPDVPISFDFHEVCEGKGFRDTAPFAGPGPHPIKIPILGPDAPAGGGELQLLYVPEIWKEQNPQAVQLVACIIRRPGPHLKTCRYVGTLDPSQRWTADVRWADYTIDVRAARTGQKVAPTVRVRGGNTECHDYDIRGSSDDPAPLLTSLTKAQFMAAVGRWVTRPR